MFSKPCPGFGDEVKGAFAGTYALSSGYYEEYYLQALKVRQLIKQDFERILADYDLIICPTTTHTAFKIDEEMDDPLILYMNDILTVPVNMAGLPGMSIPCGFASGMPIGMQIIGRAFDEGSMLKAAFAFEQQTEFHSAKPHLEVK